MNQTVDKKLDLTVNRLPLITWNHLHMNQCNLSLRVPETGAEVKEQTWTPDAPEGQTSDPAVLVHEGHMDLLRDFSEVETGMGADVVRLLTAGGYTSDVYRLREGEGTVKLKYALTGNGVTANFLGLDVKQGAALTVIMDFASEPAAGEKAENSETEKNTADTSTDVDIIKENTPAAAAGAGVVLTKAHLGKNAILRLVQIHRAGNDFTLLSDTGAFCEDGARVELIQVVLSGKNTLIGAAVNLNGKGSTFSSNLGYRVEKDHRLDINYTANHFGRRTQCDINAVGVLRDTARKIFRGTIDFRNGSGASKGNEKEDVLLMDDGVVNQTIPVILCAEEDVEGNHGATIGELDDDTLFYLESRGMSEEAVDALMERARLSSVIRKIPEEDTKKELLTCIGDE